MGVELVPGPLTVEDGTREVDGVTRGDPTPQPGRRRRDLPLRGEVTPTFQPEDRNDGRGDTEVRRRPREEDG